MKLYKRENIYKASNVIFDPIKIEAFSYSWWKFVGVVEGKVVFNNYRYSNSTSKHQSKVRKVMNELGIKIDLEIPVPRGLPGSYRRDYLMGSQVTKEDETLQGLIEAAEIHVCDVWLKNKIKAQEAYQRRKEKAFEKRLESYLENEVHFRDYDIEPVSQFGKINKIAVHQVVEKDSMERDVQNAIDNFLRDGFGSIVFYIEKEGK